MARLTLTATVDSSRTGESVEISRAGFSIGRAETNELTLADGQVSRRHAWIVKRDEQWVLHDGGGTAGTWVNGQRITEVVLQEGDQIRIAGTTMVFSAGAIYCIGCGTALDEGARFCGNCGAVQDDAPSAGEPADSPAEAAIPKTVLSLPPPDAAVAATPATTSGAPSPAPPTAVNTAQMPAERSATWPRWVVVLLVAVAIVAGFAGAAIWWYVTSG